MMAADVTERARRIKLVIVDVDGVMTDGRIIYGNYGDELKFFDVKDGLGLVLLRRAGLKTVIVSSRKSRIVQKRAKELEVVRMYQGVRDKLKIFEKMLRKFKITPEEVCYIGDDLIDLPVLRRAGLAVAVQTAVPEVKTGSHYVTSHGGGRGAVREVCDLILKTQEKWDAVTEKYRS